MKFFALFIYRPVATILLSVAITLCGILGFRMLPVAPLPQVDFPVIMVSASLPGASPETMASSVATPLERSLGRIAGVSEMTSSSSLGSTRIILQFDFDRDINGAARDVQAAINAAQSLLPSGMPSRPTYRKANPSDAPIMILTLTSDTYSQGELYDFASTQLAPTISQIDGVGDVDVGGSSLPAVRVGLNPQALFNQGVSLDDVRTAVSNANVRKPQGALEDGTHRWQIQTNDELKTAAEYQPLIIHYNNGGAVRLGDVATVTDSVQDVRNAGMTNAKPAILLMIRKLPEANIIQTVDSIRAKLPELQETIPAAIDLQIAQDRSPTIRASLEEVEQTLIISVALVILVVFLFLRSGRATIIPAVSVPVSLIGTFAAMYLCGFSLNNLSLMALTIATGFVVDDAIVVLENIARHLEAGMKPLQAALQGTREVGFTVLSMSLSLVAVFLPLLLMGGLPGRLLREFAVTLSVAIGISLLVSLTLTPMMCGWMLKASKPREQKRLRGFGRMLVALQQGYGKSLKWVLNHTRLVGVVLLGTIALNIWLYISIPKTFFPEQDTGVLMGGIQADQSISFQAMRGKLQDFMKIIRDDPAVDNVTGFTGGSRVNSGMMFITLKPRDERSETAQQIIDRLRVKLAKEPGANLFLMAVQDIRVGGAMMVPVGRLTVMKIVPREQYMAAMTFVTLPGQVGPLLGPALGGLLVEYASWHWIFLINIPVGIIGAIATLLLMPNYTMQTRRFDLSGFLLLAVGMAVLTLALDGSKGTGLSPLTIAGLVAVGVVALVLYLLHARNNNRALFSLKLFRTRTFSLGLAGSFAGRIGSGMLPFMTPVFLQIGLGFSPFHAGLMMIPMVLGSMGMKRIVVQVVNRFGYRRVLVATTLGLSLVTLLFMTTALLGWYYVLPFVLFLQGMVNSTRFSSMNTLTLKDLPDNLASSGNSLLSMIMQLSMSIGVTIAGLLLGLFGSQHVSVDSGTTQTVFMYTWLSMAFIIALPAFIFARVPNDTHQNVAISRRKRSAQ